MRSLLGVNPTVRLIVDPGSSTALDEAGLAHEVATPGRALTVDGVEVGVLGSEHAVIHPRLPNVGNNGYLLDGRVLHPGDAFLDPGDPVDVLLLPAGGPWMKIAESLDHMCALRPRWSSRSTRPAWCRSTSSWPTSCCVPSHRTAPRSSSSMKGLLARCNRRRWGARGSRLGSAIRPSHASRLAETPCHTGLTTTAWPVAPRRPQVDLRQLRQFVAVAEELHFGRAAARLYMTQPALSRTVQQLEREVGAQLLLRHPRLVALTEAGRLLLPGAYRLLAEADAVKAGVQEQASARSPSDLPSVVRIGLHDGLAALTPVIYDALLRRCPGIEVRVRTLSYDELISAVRRRRVDAVLGVDSVEVQESTFLPVFADPRVAMVSARSELAAARELGIADLLDEPSVNADGLPERVWGPYLLADHRNGEMPRFATGGSAPRSGVDVVRQVSNGFGTAVVSAKFAAWMNEPGVRLVPVRDATPFAVGVWTPAIATAASRAVSAVLREVAPSITALAPPASSLLPAEPPVG